MTKSFTALCALLCAIALVGCRSKPDQTSEIPVEKCAQSPVALLADDGCKNKKCRLTVDKPDTGPAIVSPYRLSVPKNDKDVTIIWRLKDPSKYEFTQADGPKNLKNTNAGGNEADFSDGSPTDDDDGAAKKTKGKSYRVKYSSATPSQEYKYEIQFSAKDGSKVYKCDPLINNAGV